MSRSKGYVRHKAEDLVEVGHGVCEIRGPNSVRLG
jgi:hypothetical protein